MSRAQQVLHFSASQLGGKGSSFGAPRKGRRDDSDDDDDGGGGGPVYSPRVINGDNDWKSRFNSIKAAVHIVRRIACAPVLPPHSRTLNYSIIKTLLEISATQANRQVDEFYVAFSDRDMLATEMNTVSSSELRAIRARIRQYVDMNLNIEDFLQELLDGNFSAAYNIVMSQIDRKTGGLDIPFKALMKKLKLKEDFKAEYADQNKELATILATYGDFRGNIYVNDDAERNILSFRSNWYSSEQMLYSQPPTKPEFVKATESVTPNFNQQDLTQNRELRGKVLEILPRLKILWNNFRRQEELVRILEDQYNSALAAPAVAAPAGPAGPGVAAQAAGINAAGKTNLSKIEDAKTKQTGIMFEMIGVLSTLRYKKNAGDDPPGIPAPAAVNAEDDRASQPFKAAVTPYPLDVLDSFSLDSSFINDINTAYKASDNAAKGLRPLYYEISHLMRQIINLQPAPIVALPPQPGFKSNSYSAARGGMGIAGQAIPSDPGDNIQDALEKQLRALNGSSFGQRITVFDIALLGGLHPRTYAILNKLEHVPYNENFFEECMRFYDTRVLNGADNGFSRESDLGLLLFTIELTQKSKHTSYLEFQVNEPVSTKPPLFGAAPKGKEPPRTANQYENNFREEYAREKMVYGNDKTGILTVEKYCMECLERGCEIYLRVTEKLIGKDMGEKKQMMDDFKRKPANMAFLQNFARLVGLTIQKAQIDGPRLDNQAVTSLNKRKRDNSFSLQEAWILLEDSLGLRRHIQIGIEI